jgi:class 3 adenylate cyclase
MEINAERIDRSEKAIRIILRILEILYSLVVIGWVVGPNIPRVVELFPGLMPVQHIPFHKYDGSLVPNTLSIVLAVGICLPIAVSIFKLLSPLLSRKLPRLAVPNRSGALLLTVLETTSVLAIYLYYFFEFARKPLFFINFSLLSYGIFAFSLLFNAFCLYRLIVNAGNRDEDYREYLAFKRGPGKKAMRQAGLTHGIQKKLVLSFLPLILIIIVVLSLALMASFRKTIIDSIIESGQRLAVQAANVIKSNPADKIAVDDYFMIESRKNESSKFPFQRLCYFVRNPSENSFSLSAIAVSQTQINDSQNKHDESNEEINSKVDTRNIQSFKEPFFESTKDTYSFFAPVLLSTAYLGYVRVDYDRYVIFEPYFRTLVRVISFAAIFTYIGALLIVLIGRNIVVPILYLRMSVASISASLSSMVKGEKRVTAENLQYKDRVATKDEIKGLSNEVGSMTTVLRGIVPYISASTLKHSKRETPMNELRELCFLFTDIRGFTGLCEGLSPEEVVSLLNRYLELQSSIIISNGGDIDKFVGDEVMAVFDGPEKELHAVKTAIEIKKAMETERNKAVVEKKHIIEIGIGINSGRVVFGSIGAKDRMDFTSIGDSVNLAARLEGANKAYGTKALISDVVYEKVKEQYLCHEVDRLVVKGKSMPISVYELVEQKDKATIEQQQYCALFEKSLRLYRRRDWDKAELGFKMIHDRYDDETSSVFLKRISHFRKAPPPDSWDGVFNLMVK